MQALLLSLHVVAGILFVGPVAVTASLFPRYAPVIGDDGGERNADIARVLARVTGVYAILAIAVPGIGIALAIVQGRMTEIWVNAAMVLTAAAGVLLAAQIAPRQRNALEHPDDGTQLKRLGMVTGIFNLLWVVVVVLMIVRPGAGYR